MPSGFDADHEMLDALAALRAGGMPVALVTNSFGRDCYDGFDLHALADVVVISSDVVPSRDGLSLLPLHAAPTWGLMATSQAQCSWTRLVRPYSVVAVTSCRNNPWGEHGG